LDRVQPAGGIGSSFRSANYRKGITLFRHGAGYSVEAISSDYLDALGKMDQWKDGPIFLGTNPKMNRSGLSTEELDLFTAVFRRHPEIARVALFGSRAKGNHRPASDVDLALWGEVDPLGGESVARELDELPFPYRFDVVPFSSIRLDALRKHIERVGITIYRHG
jgi:predicted nucleotidyltransferase